MATNNNNSNVIRTKDRQEVRNRDMVGITTPQQINSVGIKKGSPIDKNIILVKKYSRCSISRKIETFCRSLTEKNTGFQNFRHSKRIQNSISFKTCSVKNSFQTNSESRKGRIGETGGKKNVEEGSHQKSSTIKRGVCKQLIPCKK